MGKTPEEIKKGLECCSKSNSCPQECPYYDVPSCGSVSKLDALAYINELKEREWQLFDLLSSTRFTKACYFKQEDGTVYSRVSGEYMTFEQAIDEFAHELTDEAQVQKWISVEDRLPDPETEVLV